MYSERLDIERGLDAVCDTLKMVEGTVIRLLDIITRGVVEGRYHPESLVKIAMAQCGLEQALRHTERLRELANTPVGNTKGVL